MSDQSKTMWNTVPEPKAKDLSVFCQIQNFQREATLLPRRFKPYNAHHLRKIAEDSGASYREEENPIVR